MSYYVKPDERLEADFNGDTVFLKYVTDENQIKFFDLFDRLGESENEANKKKISKVFRDASEWIDLFVDKIIDKDGKTIDTKKIKVGKKMDIFGIIQDNLSELSGLDLNETKN